MNRKIISIATYTHDNTPCILALCDDGSLWKRTPQGRWSKIDISEINK